VEPWAAHAVDGELGGGAVGLLIAVGIGLLIGAERERRKQEQTGNGVAGIRTFTVAAMAGAVSLQVGGAALLGATTLVVGILVVVSYWAERHNPDPGLTTEIALILTLLLGALATANPPLAGMGGVATAILLAARTPLQRFVGSVLSTREMWDGLILAGATLIVLPLLPDRPLDPYGVLNPRSLWLIVILVLSIGAAGYIAIRLVGTRTGLPLAGLLGGFVSSTATIGAMGARARTDVTLRPAAAAGAVLSTVATMVQLGLLLMVSSPATLRAAGPSLLAGGAVALAFGIGTTLRAMRHPAPDEAYRGAAFSLRAAAVFAATVAVVLLGSAATQAHFGEQGLLVVAALAGLVDAHAAAISISSLVAAQQVSPSEGLIPILVAVSTNTASKLIVARISGGRAFLLRVGPGLMLVALATWVPAFLRIFG